MGCDNRNYLQSGTMARRGSPANHRLGLGLANPNPNPNPNPNQGETFVLPPLPPRVHAEEATVTATLSATLEANAAGITALRAHLAKIGYNLTPEEDKSLNLRDAHGKVDCTLVVNGFPVHPRNPWLGPAGGGIAASMMAHAMQLGSCGLLDKFCRVDIFPGARHYREGKNLDRETMAETAR